MGSFEFKDKLDNIADHLYYILHNNFINLVQSALESKNNEGVVTS